MLCLVLCIHLLAMDYNMNCGPVAPLDLPGPYAPVDPLFLFTLAPVVQVWVGAVHD